MTACRRWIAAAALALSVLATAGCPRSDTPPNPPPSGWVEVPCSPWPGGEGPCYAPPDEEAKREETRRHNEEAERRRQCEWTKRQGSKEPC